jgi:hypothetical protein
LCSIILEKSPDTTDLHSDLVSLNRFSKIDWDDLNTKINKLGTDCQESRDKLIAIAKHDTDYYLKLKKQQSERVSCDNLKTKANHECKSLLK